ncbi:hypothetical protein AAG570_011820, partial [Ranatra chinensis]
FFFLQSTYILKRRYPPKLLKKGQLETRFKARDYIYDLVEDTDIKKKPDVQVILKTSVEGIGNMGDCVTLKRNMGYQKLLLPGLAEYATPEAIERMKSLKASRNQLEYSSPTAPGLVFLQTVSFLRRQILSVVMNKELEWTLEPWHIRVAFRKAGIHMPQDAIQLPDKPIKGPDLNLEGKDFIVTVTINKREKVGVRCRIHHWSTSLANRLQYVKYPWMLEGEPIFEEQAAELGSLPLPKPKFQPTEQTSSA